MATILWAGRVVFLLEKGTSFPWGQYRSQRPVVSWQNLLLLCCLTAEIWTAQWRLAQKSPSVSVIFAYKSVILRENFKSSYWRVSFATKVYPSAVGLSTLYVSHKSLWFLIYYYHYLSMPHSMDCVLIGRIFFFFPPREGRIYYLQQERITLAFPKQCLWLVWYSEYIKGLKVVFFFLRFIY